MSKTRLNYIVLAVVAGMWAKPLSAADEPVQKVREHADDLFKELEEMEEQHGKVPPKPTAPAMLATGWPDAPRPRSTPSLKT